MYESVIVAWMIRIANIIVMIGANLLVQSTLIVGIGLLAARVVKPWGAAMQSVVLRLFVVALFLSPLLSVGIGYTGFTGMTITIPLPQSSTSVPPSSSDRAAEGGKYLPRAASGGAAVDESEAKTPVVSPDTVGRSRPVQSRGAGRIRGVTDSARGTVHPLRRTFHDMIASIHAAFGGIRYVVYLIIALVWMSLSGLMLVRLFTGHILIQRLRMESIPASRYYHGICGELAGKLGIRMPVVLVSHQVTMPFVSGYFRPCIHLPGDGVAASLPVRAILLHELGHCVRHDPIWNLLRNLATALIPFQPLVWVLSRRIEETSDFACDDVVVAHMGNHHEYARTLVDAARVLHANGRDLIATVNFLSPVSPLKRRILRLLDQTSLFVRRVSAGLTASVGLLCLSTMIVTGFIGIEGAGSIRAVYTREGDTGAPISREVLAIRFPAQYLSYTALSRHPLNIAPGMDGADVHKTVNDRDLKDSRHEATAAIDSMRDHGDPTVLDEIAMSPDVVSVRTIGRGSVSVGLDSIKNMMTHPAGMPENDVPGQGAITGPAMSTGSFDDAVADGPSVGLVSMDIHSSAREAVWISSPDSVRKIAASKNDQLISGGMPYQRPPTAKIVAVDLEADYESTSFDLRDPEQRKLYSRYQSIHDTKSEPVWSPDGKVIAFANHSRIWTVPVEGGKPTLVFENEYENFAVGRIESLSFSPDGMRMLFKRDVYDTGRGSSVEHIKDPVWGEYVLFSDPVPTITSITVDGGSGDVLDDAVCGSYSPDGQYMTCLIVPAEGRTGARFSRENVVPAVYSLETGTYWTIDSHDGAWYGKPSMMPDDTGVIVPIRQGDGPVELYRLSRAGGDRELLDFRAGIDSCPANIDYLDISPDGQWVLFTGYTDTPGTPGSRLYVLHLPTCRCFSFFEDTTNVTAYGRWSPDGSQICYIATTDEEKAIYTCDFITPIITKPVVVAAEPPHAFGLSGNYPNPFNMSTTIEFSLPQEGTASLVIFNIAAQVVREVVDRRLDAGRHQVVWDGRDDNGMAVSSGMYFAYLRFGTRVDSHKMLLTK